MYHVKSPILLLVFNRLDTARRVFERIALAKPGRLYIGCDGARTHKAGEAAKVQELRDWLLQNIDWPCEVKTLFRDQNLGCCNAVQSAISWFFAQEESGIILEDDCLAEESYFQFCDELLEKYKDTPEVMAIGGTGYTEGHAPYPESYHFSTYFHCWGWATWRRAWDRYDVDIKGWPAFKQQHGLSKMPQSNIAFNHYWTRIFDMMYNSKAKSTWDYQMSFAVFSNSGLCIEPAMNLVSNIGFGDGATHTMNNDHEQANRKIYKMPFPLVHPVSLTPNVELDKAENRICYDISWQGELKVAIRGRLSKVKRTLMRLAGK